MVYKLLKQRVLIVVMGIVLLVPVSSYALSGSYTGEVDIATPIALGTVDLALNLVDSNGSLSGNINADHTIIFPKGGNQLGPSLTTGTVNTSTPTNPAVNITINFSHDVSGRTVTRQITLTGTAGQPTDTQGDPVGDQGDLISGTYQEVITGFIPETITVQGTFELLRPSALNPCSDRNGDGSISIDEAADGGVNMYKIELNEMLAALRIYFNSIGAPSPPITLTNILAILGKFYQQLGQ